VVLQSGQNRRCQLLLLLNLELKVHLLQFLQDVGHHLLAVLLQDKEAKKKKTMVAAELLDVLLVALLHLQGMVLVEGVHQGEDKMTVQFQISQLQLQDRHRRISVI